MHAYEYEYGLEDDDKDDDDDDDDDNNNNNNNRGVNGRGWGMHPQHFGREDAIAPLLRRTSQCHIQLSLDCHSSCMNGDIWR